LPQIIGIGASMTRIIAKMALLLFALALPATATAQAILSGQWKNPKGSVVVRLGPCGNAVCGVVVDASEHAKDTARKGGTPNLIGTRILSGLRPAGDGTFKGQAFDPKRNIHAPATVRLIGRDALEVEGCAFLGLVCKEQRWTRVS
jgi:uncharacterized protein (DUF2147 family)